MKKARRKNEHFATSSFIQTFRMEFLYSILTLHEIQSYHFSYTPKYFPYDCLRWIVQSTNRFQNFPRMFWLYLHDKNDQTIDSVPDDPHLCMCFLL